MANYIGLPPSGGLPDQTGQSGNYLTTDGSNASWAAVNSLPSQGGNAGLFLTTNGTTASWGSILPASLPSPLQYINFVEDFTVGFVSTGGGSITAEHNWFTWTSGASPAYRFNTGNMVPSTAANPGVVQLGVTTNADSASIFTGNSGLDPSQGWFTGSGAMSLTYVFKINALNNGTDNQTIAVGYMNGIPVNGTQDCMRFEYSSGSTFWVTKTMASSTATTTTTSTAVTSGWHRAMVVCDAAAANVTFFMDGVLIATHTTNIPTAKLSLGFSIQKTLGSSNPCIAGVDLIWAQKALTASR